MAEFLAEADGLCRDMFAGGQICEQEEHGESIVEVTQGVDKGRVSLLDDVVELELGSKILLEARSIAGFSATEGACNLLRNGLVLTELR